MKSILALLILFLALSSDAQVHRRLLLASRQAAAAGGGGSAPVKVDTSSVDRDDASDNPETFTLTQSTLGSGGYVTVEISQNASGPAYPSAVTYDGLSMVKLTGSTNATDTGLSTWIYGLAVGAKASGTYTISVTLTGGKHFIGHCTSWNGVNQSTGVGSQAGANGTSTIPSVTVSSASSETVINCIAYSGTGASSATIVGGTATSLFNNNDAGAQVDGAASFDTGAASTTMSWTLSSSFAWASCAVALKP